MNDVYIVGSDMIRFGRFPDKTVPMLGAESALLALDDAGVSITDIQALYCGNQLEAKAMSGQRILHLVGQTGIPVINCANACATGATAMREGWMGIKAGVYDLVLCVGVEQMGKGLLGSPVAPNGIPVEGLLGSGTMPAVVCHGRHGTRTKARDNLRTICASLGQESLSLTIQPQGDVPKGSLACGSHGRGDDCLSQHQAHVLSQCGWRRGGSSLASEKKAKELGLMSRAVRIRASILTSDPYLGARSRHARLQRLHQACGTTGVRNCATWSRGFGPCRIARLFRNR